MHCIGRFVFQGQVWPLLNACINALPTERSIARHFHHHWL